MITDGGPYSLYKESCNGCKGYGESEGDEVKSLVGRQADCDRFGFSRSGLESEPEVPLRLITIGTKNIKGHSIDARDVEWFDRNDDPVVLAHRWRSDLIASRVKESDIVIGVEVERAELQDDLMERAADGRSSPGRGL